MVVENHCHEVEATLTQERISVANLNKSLKEEVDRSTSFQDIINTMTSLITATAPDFRVEKLLGTGSNAAAFKVQYLTAFDNNSIRSSALTTSSTTTKRGRDMVMKVLFNWENTPQQTMLRQKYMAECVTLSLIPNHPNIIHPLGAIVIPGLPSEYVEKIPSDKSFFRNELCTHKSLAILMPHAGITLGEFLCALLSTSNKEKVLETVLTIFVQGTKAIQHIEAHSIVHRDIKQDNILIAPESGKLTLIDFGEAQQCCPPNMEMMITATTQPWGNTGTMPPELSMFLKATATTRGGPVRAGPALFSLSKILLESLNFRRAKSYEIKQVGCGTSSGRRRTTVLPLEGSVSSPLCNRKWLIGFPNFAKTCLWKIVGGALSSEDGPGVHLAGISVSDSLLQFSPLCDDVVMIYSSDPVVGSCVLFCDLQASFNQNKVVVTSKSKCSCFENLKGIVLKPGGSLCTLHFDSTHHGVLVDMTTEEEQVVARFPQFAFATPVGRNHLFVRAQRDYSKFKVYNVENMKLTATPCTWACPAIPWQSGLVAHSGDVSISETSTKVTFTICDVATGFCVCHFLIAFDTLCGDAFETDSYLYDNSL
ncbi:hypothetical protein Pelo_4421 [Pelomyxa schiedti]|nr:hypothetical protein Pelo_4421 [Pelomyxa schiedti]